MRNATRLAGITLVVSLLSGTLAGQTPATAAQTPAEWTTVSDQVSKLNAFNKTAEAIGVLEKFLARFPNVAEAHRELATAHLYLGSPLLNTSATPAERTRHLERAATGFRRALDLMIEPDRRLRLSEELAYVYEKDMLNRPAEAVAVARAMVTRHPTLVEAYILLANVLKSDPTALAMEVGRWRGAADVLRKAPDRTGRAGLALHELGAFLMQIVRESPELPPTEARQLLEEVREIFDGLIKTSQGVDEVHAALLGKSMALKLQAERVEKDAARVKALLAEAEELAAQAGAVRKRQQR